MSIKWKADFILFLFFFLNPVGDCCFTVSISLRGRRRNPPVLNIPFCLYLVVDEHGHLKIYLPKKLLECLPKCTSLPKERHRWNTNEVRLYHPGSCTFLSLPMTKHSFFFRPLFLLRPSTPRTIMFAICDQIISIDRAVWNGFCPPSFIFYACICCQSGSFIISTPTWRISSPASFVIFPEV